METKLTEDATRMAGDLTDCVSWSSEQLEKPFIVGLEAPLRGSQSATGRDMWRGALLAAEQLNCEGGVRGRPVQLVKANDSADPEMAATVVRKLRRKGADAVIGPYNSAVGIENIDNYLRKDIFPVHLTSSDQTSGKGATIQPKNSQISPVESDYILKQKVKNVSMLVDPSTYTQGMAERLKESLTNNNINVTTIEIKPGQDSYRNKVRRAIKNNPDLVYLSTYFPEGSTILQDLEATGSQADRFLGLANVDQSLISNVGLKLAQTAVFSGVPEAAQLPTAKAYVEDYRTRFNKEPGVWGAFTYDSLKLLKDAANRAGTIRFNKLSKAVVNTMGYEGQTGQISIDPITGNRKKLPIFALKVNNFGEFIPMT